jgi:hypothetical protein
VRIYSAGFARAYNMRWGDFARQVAPLIHDLYASTPVGRANRSVFNLCCGTGQLAVYFLEKEGRVFVVARRERTDRI